MSKDYHGEFAKFSELVWFRILAKQPKLAEQWREAHWVGKSERSAEHLLAIRGSTCAIRREPRDEQWNLESVKAVLVSPWELQLRTDFDAPLTRQKYITNQMLDPAWSNTALHKMLIGYRITFVRLSSLIQGHLYQGAC